MSSLSINYWNCPYNLKNYWGYPILPYPYDVRASLDRECLEDRINNILNYIHLGADYYWITEEINSTELQNRKWKTYLFLRRCVLNYRAGQIDELLNVLNFLSVKRNEKWLATSLLDPVQQMNQEQWGTSKHEWLERCRIIDVIKRSAGMVPNVDPATRTSCTAGEIDWLYVQAVVRSSNKYIFFRNTRCSIEEGHPGAVKPDLQGRGFSSRGSSDFHESLNRAFDQSTTILGFLKRVKNIFHSTLISGKKHISPSIYHRYVVDGTLTSSEHEINDFRRDKLRPEGYEPFREFLSNFEEFIFGLEGEVVEEIEDIASESSEDELEKIDFDSSEDEDNYDTLLVAWENLNVV